MMFLDKKNKPHNPSLRGHSSPDNGKGTCCLNSLPFTRNKKWHSTYDLMLIFILSTLYPHAFSLKLALFARHKLYVQVVTTISHSFEILRGYYWCPTRTLDAQIVELPDIHFWHNEILNLWEGVSLKTGPDNKVRAFLWKTFPPIMSKWYLLGLIFML